MEGSAKLISTKYGQGISLNGFGPRFASTKMTNISNFFTVINEYRRGISIHIWIRIDNLAINKHIFISSPQFVVGSNLGSLFVRLSTLDKVWFFISKDILNVFSWQSLVISWRRDNGLKVYLNGEFIGHVLTGTDETHKYSYFKDNMYFGKEYLKSSTDYATVLIDDVEFFEADLSNLAYEVRDLKNISCSFQHSFDQKKRSRARMQLGVIGNAGVFYDNTTVSERLISLPQCFYKNISGCNDCFSLRFWVSINHLNMGILQTTNLKLFVSAKNLSVDIIDQSRLIHRIFICKYNNRDLVRSWYFIEISWHSDEGLLFFINRELLICENIKNGNIIPKFSKSLQILDSFVGSIDEFEIYKSRLSILYWRKLIDENKIDYLLQKLQYKIKLQKDMVLMTKNSRQGKSNFTVKYIQSFEFNGSNYLEYKMPIIKEIPIMGAKEEIEVSFKSLDNIINSVIWISDGSQSKSILSLKNGKLYFTKIYITPTLNGSKRVSEEFEIYQNIKPNIVYNLLIYQKSGQFVMKITSIYETSTQSMIGRESLLPINSNVYFGGFKNQEGLEFNSTNTSFVGIIYKAKIKSVFDKEAVDIIQEMAEVKSNPNIINHGNVKVVMKSTETILSSKASFLGTIIDRKMSLMIVNHFTSVILPKWDFELIVSFEIEFSTYESQGLLIFIGNASHFIAFELFDSQIYFVYKFNGLWKRVGIDERNHVVNDNHFHNVYLGRDLSGNIKVFIDKKETINNVYIPTEFHNSSTIIGFYGSFQKIPPEILSKSSFIGCIHFVGINDEGFLNFTRWSPFINKPRETFGLLKQVTEPFMVDSCLSPKKTTCDSSPCKPGWCQLTSISSIGQPVNNFKCNCLYSSKTLSNKFTGSSDIENYNIWIKRNMLESRSQSCDADVTQILVIENSYFQLNLKIAYPFLSVIDLEFMVLMSSTNSCVVKISDIDKLISIELNVIDGLLYLTMTKNFHFTVANITISDGQWHGVNLRVRPGMIQLKIDNIEKVLDSSVFSLVNFSTVIFGHCTSFNQSHFRIKNLLYNYLNPLENMSFFSSVLVNNLFYKTDYVYPSPGVALKEKQHKLIYPVTFLNNFINAITNSSIKLSWINEIEIEMKIQHPGSFAHFISKDKFISIIVCNVNHLVIVYKDGYLKSERLDVRISNESLKIKIIIDLIKAVIKYENVLLKETHQITKHLYSWQIGDDMWIEFGINKEHFKYILSENLNFNHDKCLHELSNKTVIGCLQNFYVSNNKYIWNINDRWNSEMHVSPATSVLVGRCLDVKICHRSSCENGKCILANFTEIICDCSSTPFMGSQCHLPKPQCTSNSCKNNGRCVSGLLSFTCYCKGTGYTGRYCEVSLCNNVDCLNTGICQVIDDFAQCNCLSTGFTGQYCEKSLCDLYTCSNQGFCRLDKKLKIPVCDCNFGYFGDNCESNGTTKCEKGCLNGGLCTLYSPVMKLCSNSNCKSYDKLFDCNCDNTIYSGQFCEQGESGFNPYVDGVIEMDRIKVEKYNYLRILMEPISRNEKMSLLHVTFSKNHYYILFMEEEHLWLIFRPKYDKNEEKFSLGRIKPVNVLLLVESATLISYVLNSEFGNISLSNIFPNFVRVRRSSSNDRINNFPKLILGSDSNDNHKFNGLIAGFRWNGRDIMNNNNIIKRAGKSFPIRTLKTKVFPRQDPHLMLQKSFFIPLILVILILFIMALFYCFRKQKKLIKPQDLQNGDFIPLFSNMKNSDENIIENETVIVPSYSQKAMNSDSSHFQILNKLFIISDISDLSNLRILDILILHEDCKCAVVVRSDQFLKARKVFPSNDSDRRYNCVSIAASSNLRFAYSHMKHIDSINDDIVELQVWKIHNDWSRVCSPPNIKFTHSMVKPGNSTELILFNCHFLTIFIWLLDFSDIIWQTTLTPSINSSFHSFSISQDTRYLFFNNIHANFSVDLLENPSFLNAVDSNIPNIGILEQILSIQNDEFLIRTENNYLYIYTVSIQLFRRILQSHKVILVTKFQRGDQVKWALGLDTGEIYLTNDLERNQYHILGPRNKNPISIITFSNDASLICAGFATSLVHIWKIKPDISVCRFYAFHINNLLTQLYFTADDRFIIAAFPTSDNKSERVLLTSSRI